jgi:hypothetical protein
MQPAKKGDVVENHKGIVRVLGAVIAVTTLLGLAAGLRTFQGANLHKAQVIASRLQAEAQADPVTTSAGPATSVAVSPGTTAAPNTSKSTPAPTNAPTTAAAAKAPSSTVTHSASTSTAGSSTTAAGGSPVSSAAAPKAATGVARRTPTAAELSQAIAAVHSLLPTITPTVAQIADAGNQVCTLFDQGQTAAQVKNQMLSVVGLGSLSFMIPASVPDTAVRTLVALYCPGYASKLS